MKAMRVSAVVVCGAVCLALFSGCETQKSACEREKRLTERMDEMQMDLDGRITGVNGEIAGMRANPPVVVQTVPGPPEPSIRIDESDYSGRSRADEMAALAAMSREEVVYSPPARATRSTGQGNIRVPVPARTVQAALKEAGFYNGAVDGKVGKQTIAAITAFQRSQGIKADGIVGRVTWQHLQAFVPAGMSTTRLK